MTASGMHGCCKRRVKGVIKVYIAEGKQMASQWLTGWLIKEKYMDGTRVANEGRVYGWYKEGIEPIDPLIEEL